MTSDRPYRQALPADHAFDELERFAGTQFDPELVEVALDASAQLDAARLELAKKKTGDYFVN